MARVKKMTITEGEIYNLSEFPNFHKSGSIKGMRQKYYGGKSALLVKCGNYIYNVSSAPQIYENAN